MSPTDLAIGAGSTRLHYKVTPGERGPWVLLIHGLGLSSRFWFDLPERLATAPDPCRVITFDNRGTGQSDCPRPPYRIGDMADDAVAVLDAVGVAAAYVVGISLGGMIAQHVALRHPTRTLGLVLLATTPGMPEGHLPRPGALMSLIALGSAPLDRPIPALGRLLLSKRDRPRSEELLVEWPATMATEPLRTRGFLGQLAAATMHSTASSLAAIRCPTVIVGADEDVLQPPENSRLLARLIPHAALEVLREVGHGILLVDRDVVPRSLAQLQRATSPKA